MTDFVQGLDPSKLVLFGTGLSLIVLPWDVPTYNFPLFLFGSLVQELPDAPQSLRTFVGLLGASVVLDLIFLIKHSQHFFIRLVTIIIMILKLPTWLAFANGIRQQGGSFSGLNVGGNDIGGATVWSMPGGFTGAGRGGYQNVDAPTVSPNVAKPPGPSPPPAKPGQPSGGYQTV